MDALRLEEIDLWDRASRVYAELGPDHLRDRFQCLNNAAWTEHERDDAAAGAARFRALIDEARSLPEDEVPEWLLPSAERVIAQLEARGRGCPADRVRTSPGPRRSGRRRFLVDGRRPVLSRRAGPGLR